MGKINRVAGRRRRRPRPSRPLRVYRRRRLRGAGGWVVSLHRLPVAPRAPSRRGRLGAGQDDLAAIEGLGVARDRAFQAPDAHQAEERLALVPVLDLLAGEVLGEEIDLPADVFL